MNQVFAEHGLEIRHSEDRGRYPVARRSISAGEIVLSSLPVAWVLNAAEANDRCHECLQRSRGLLRCSRCKWAQYCTKECQARAWKNMHKRECGVLPVLVSELHGVALDEAVLLTRVIMAMEKRSNDDVWHLPHHATPERLADNKIVVDVVMDALGKLAIATYSEGRVAELLCAMQCNNFSIWSDILVPVASGCYPAGALLNHSCAPNCVLYYDLSTKRQNIRSIRAISKGEELVHSYIDIAAPRAERQAKLKVQYNFTCTCAKCADDLHDPVLTAAHDGSIATPNRELERARTLHARGVSLQCNEEEERRALSEALAIREKELHGLNLDVLATRSALLNTLLATGDLAAALPVCRAIVDTYEQLYPAKHPMIGLQYFTLGDLYEHQNMAADARAAHRRALDILRISHDRNSDMLKILAEKLGVEE